MKVFNILMSALGAQALSMDLAEESGRMDFMEESSSSSPLHQALDSLSIEQKDEGDHNYTTTNEKPVCL